MKQARKLHSILLRTAIVHSIQGANELKSRRELAHGYGQAHTQTCYSFVRRLLFKRNSQYSCPSLIDSAHSRSLKDHEPFATLSAFASETKRRIIIWLNPASDAVGNNFIATQRINFHVWLDGSVFNQRLLIMRMCLGPPIQNNNNKWIVIVESTRACEFTSVPLPEAWSVMVYGVQCTHGVDAMKFSEQNMCNNNNETKYYECILCSFH